MVSPSGDTLSTDPDGNDQWSRDLKLRTSAAGDTLPPVIVEGPVVVIRDVLAVVRFTTDVETKATVFFGTSGGTYGTPDEFEVVDRTFGAIRLERHGGQPPGAARLGDAAACSMRILYCYSSSTGSPSKSSANSPAWSAATASTRPITGGGWCFSPPHGSNC